MSPERGRGARVVRSAVGAVLGLLVEAFTVGLSVAAALAIAAVVLWVL